VARHKQKGETHLGRPMGVPKSAYAILVQDIVPSRPLGFDEAYDKVLQDWKERQRDQVARATSASRSAPRRASCRRWPS
jgi:hypothetical protein